MRIRTTIACITVALAVFAAPRDGENLTSAYNELRVLNNIFNELHTSYVDSIDAHRAISTAIDGLLYEIDPYTEYFSPSEEGDLMQIQSGEFGGVGCVISVDAQGRVIMREPTWGDPAQLAGVRHGDVLLAIDGDTLKPGTTTSEASSRLRGRPGTKVRLTLMRPYAGPDSILELDIERGLISTNSVPCCMMLPGGIGYLRISSFNTATAPAARQALMALAADNDLKGLVIDLRNNGGGVLDSAVEIAGFFLPKGTDVVTVKYRESESENNRTSRTTTDPILPDVPLAVLINGYTASASELLAGALQDLDRAVILGDRSYGKGLVQAARNIEGGGYLKVTVGRYYTPSGRLVQAIDYQHRNPDGTPMHIPDSLTNVYHTAAGREVRDGGGIMPDIKVEEPGSNQFMYNLVLGNYPYDFATRYAAEHRGEMPERAEDFAVTDQIFAEFNDFLASKDFKYMMSYADIIDSLRKAAQQEGCLTPEAEEEFSRLEQLMGGNLDRDLQYNADKVRLLLDDEIVMRFYGAPETLGRGLGHDPAVEQARSLLADPARVRAILAVPAK